MSLRPLCATPGVTTATKTFSGWEAGNAPLVWGTHLHIRCTCIFDNGE